MNTKDELRDLLEKDDFHGLVRALRRAGHLAVERKHKRFYAETLERLDEALSSLVDAGYRIVSMTGPIFTPDATYGRDVIVDGARDVNPHFIVFYE